MTETVGDRSSPICDALKYQLVGRQNKWVESVRKELHHLGIGNIWAKEWEMIKKCEE